MLSTYRQKYLTEEIIKVIEDIYKDNDSEIKFKKLQFINIIIIYKYIYII